MVSVILLGMSAASGRPALPGDAVRTLSVLVAAAVEGVVRDVQLLGDTAGPDLTRVAEHAGCGYVHGPLAQGLVTAAERARSPIVLLLQSGLSFDRAYIEEVAAVERRQADRPQHGIALKAAESGPLGRLLPRFAPTVGVLTTRERALAARALDAAQLWRALHPRHMFETRAWTGR